MNKNKVSYSLYKDVNILNNQTKIVFIHSTNFNLTKKLLKTLNINFKPYRFANCFCAELNSAHIDFLSTQNDISYICSTSKVQTLNKETQFLNLHNLTENKYLGNGQTICFIDTGVYPHFDFIFPTNRLVKFVDFINNKSKPYDDNGHGTFVSGVACGSGIFNNNNIGIAPLCNIVSLKALSKDGSSNSNKILDAMEWIFQNHKVYNITTVCMSFGAEILEHLDPLSKGAEALWDIGLTVVAAAGNSGPKEKTIKSPGCNPKIITVGALDISSMSVADFSSRGPTIYGHKPDLLAPAVNITSCNNKYAPYSTMSGTSVAAPIVAAICAIVKNKFPNYTNNHIKKFLLSNCKKLTGNPDIEGAGYLCF